MLCLAVLESESDFVLGNQRREYDPLIARLIILVINRPLVVCGAAFWLRKRPVGSYNGFGEP